MATLATGNAVNSGLSYNVARGGRRRLAKRHQIIGLSIARLERKKSHHSQVKLLDFLLQKV